MTTGVEGEKDVINLVAHGKQSSRIDPYDLFMGDVVGEGSFGIVYRGLYKNKYDVVIKKVLCKVCQIALSYFVVCCFSQNHLMNFQ